MYSERDMGKQNAKALKKSIKRFQRYIPTMERESAREGEREINIAGERRRQSDSSGDRGEK